MLAVNRTALDNDEFNSIPFRSVDLWRRLQPKKVFRGFKVYVGFLGFRVFRVYGF